MLALHHRLAIAGVVTATAIAVPAVALASGPGSPSGKPTPPQASAGAAYLPAMLCLAACSAATSRSGFTPSWWAIAANAGLPWSMPPLPSSAS